MTYFPKRIVMAQMTICLLAAGCTLEGDYAVTPATPAGMTVVVEYQGQSQTLGFHRPEMYSVEDMAAKAPRDFDKWYEPWEPWPRRGKDKLPNVIDLRPKYDEEGTLILGNLFRSVRSDSVVVKSADGSNTYEMGKDYVYNETWGQIANFNGGLGELDVTELLVNYQAGLQRLDLVQVDGDGIVSVKKGESVLVCPRLPEADEGAKALAGIYIAPWLAKDNPHYGEVGNGKVVAAGEYAITEHEIFVIDPLPPVEPINKDAMARSREILDAGGELRIAFMGASAMAGAEAGSWWADLWTEKNLGYASQLVVGLRERYPDATVTGINAFKGGTKTAYGVQMIEDVVLPAKTHLAVISFGGNDAAGPIGRGPNNPPEQFKADMLSMVQLAKSSDMEVLLVVIHDFNPWLANGYSKRFVEYRQALLDIAQQEAVGCADYYTEWHQWDSRGTPAFSQLHNWNNHPGVDGHKLYTDVLLRFFE